VILVQKPETALLGKVAVAYSDCHAAVMTAAEARALLGQQPGDSSGAAQP
jgi:hypothetical protein